MLKGDTVDNFGTYLPAPYIHIINVNDHNIEVQVSVFVSAGDGAEIKDIVTEMSNKIGLWIYATALKERFQGIVSGERPILESLTEEDSNDTDIIQILSNADGSRVFDSYVDTTGQLKFKNLVNTELYDSDGNRVWEFRISKTLVVDKNSTTSGLTIYDDTPSTIFTRDIKDIFEGFNRAYSTEGDGRLSGLYIAAFSSIYSSHSELLGAYERNQSFTSRALSDITHEIVFDGLTSDERNDVISKRTFDFNALPKSNRLELIDSNDAIYANKPIKSLMGKQYKSDGITHKEIAAYFENLTADFKTDADKEPDLSKSLNKISLTLATHKKDPDILLRLEEIHNEIGDNSSATSNGKLKLRLGKRLSSVDVAIKRGSLLRQENFRNTKVRDLRDKKINVYSPALDLLGSDKIEGKDYIYDDELNNYEYDRENNIYTNYGYFFFDYEKALIGASKISHIFDMNKLKNLFGITIPYSSFYLDRAVLTRQETSDTNVKIISYFYTDDDNSDYYPKTQRVDIQNTAKDTNVVFRPDKYLGANAGDDLFGFTPTKSKIYPMLVVRDSFFFTDDSIVTNLPNEYKIMLMEYQDLYTYTAADKYNVLFRIRDNTPSEIQKIISSYKNSLEQLGDYLELAKTECSINDSTGDFNDFFESYAVAEFGTTPDLQPWNVAATVYTLHTDLLFDTFRGESSEIIDNIANIIKNINPTSGNITEIETFYNSMQKLWDNAYDPDTGEVMEFMDDREPFAEIGVDIERDLKRWSKYRAKYGSSGDGGGDDTDIASGGDYDDGTDDYDNDDANAVTDTTASIGGDTI